MADRERTMYHLISARIYITLAHTVAELGKAVALVDPHLAMECDSEYIECLNEARTHLQIIIRKRKEN